MTIDDIRRAEWRPGFFYSVWWFVKDATPVLLAPVLGPFVIAYLLLELTWSKGFGDGR